MTLSQAELAAMPRTTPTELAEAAYARSRRAHDMRVPVLRSVYRPTIDGNLLSKIGSAAVDAFEQDKLPASDAFLAAMAIRSELLALYPGNEMQILEKWDFALARKAVFVHLPGGNQFRVEFLSPVLVPRAAPMDFVVDPTKAGIPVPDSTGDFFARAAEVAEARAAVRWRLNNWPGQFKNNEKRWPRWDEIAAAWPLIAAWFAAQSTEGSLS